jgi:hypothetical protein
MPQILIVVWSFLLSGISKILSPIRNAIGYIVDFLFLYWPTIVKWWVFVSFISLTSNILLFWLYHFYYWSAYFLSHIVNTYTLNIIHYAFTWYLVFLIYIFLNRD